MTIQNPNRDMFWRRFRSNRVTVFSAILFGLLVLSSALAPLIANDRPVVMVFEGKWYFPGIRDYRPADIYPVEKSTNLFVIDYWAIKPDIEAKGWALWPLINQRPYESNLNFAELPAPPGSKVTVDLVSPISDTAHTKEIYHWLGTDTAGRDLVTRILYGCRTSLLMALATTLMAMIIGSMIGLLMGYLGGWFDMITGRLLEAIGYFPVIFMIIILVAFLENPGISSIIAIFVLLNLGSFAFYMRGQVLAIRQLTYIEAARSLGESPLKIMIRHILPNSLGPILVLIPFSITSDISFLATIDFLGFGVQPPTASLGAILRSGFDQIEHRWWLVAYTSLVLITILVLINFIGDGIREGLDPHTQLNKKNFKKWVRDIERKKTTQHSTSSPLRPNAHTP